MNAGIKEFLIAMTPYRYTKYLDLRGNSEKVSPMFLELLSSSVMTVILFIWFAVFIVNGGESLVEWMTKGTIVRLLIVSIIIKLMAVFIGWEDYKKLSDIHATRVNNEELNND